MPPSTSTAAGRGALLAMPLLIINMGGEMVYILEQRLRAQEIPVDKSRKVLTDVVKTMYSTKFMTELFKPQEVYTNKSTRQIFDRLAHSSIMRLNQHSMDKLYDLMTMGFKFQMLTCSLPNQLIEVTLNHLDALDAIVSNPSVSTLLTDARAMVIEAYADLPLGECYLLKQVLAGFFQDRRVKVSLFLQDGTQNMDGSLVFNPAGPLPSGTEPTGIMRSVQGDGSSKTAEVEELVVHGTTAAPTLNTPLEPSRNCKLGTNMYNKPRPKQPIPPVRMRRGGARPAAAATPVPEPAVAATKTSAAPSAGGAGGAAGAAAGTRSTAASDSKTSESGRTTRAKAGLNMLADLLGTSAVDTTSNTFKITNLFAQDVSASEGKDSETVDVITIDATDRATMTDMMAKLGWEDESTPAGAGNESKGDEEEDDLLALMDSAM